MGLHGWAFATEQQIDDANLAARLARRQVDVGFRDIQGYEVFTFAKITSLPSTIDFQGETISGNSKIAKGVEVEFNPKSLQWEEVEGGMTFDDSESNEGERATGYIYSDATISINDVVEVMPYFDDTGQIEWLIRKGGAGSVEAEEDVPWRAYFGSNNLNKLTYSVAAGNGADGKPRPEVTPDLLTITNGLMIKTDAALLTKAPSEIKRRDYGDSGEDNVEKDSISKDETLYYYALITNLLTSEIDFTISAETEVLNQDDVPQGEAWVRLFNVTASEYTFSQIVDGQETDGRKGLEYSISQIQEDTIDFSILSTYIQYLAKIKTVVDNETFTADIFRNSTLSNPELEDVDLVSTSTPLSKLAVDDVVPVVALNDGKYAISGLIEL